MSNLLAEFGGSDRYVWRVDQKRYASTWKTGEGSFLVGGRWNSAGRRAVYTSLDGPTSTLEVAVHKTFGALDKEPHVLTRARIKDMSAIHIVMPDDVPNPNWLVPGVVTAGQRQFGDELLDQFPAFAIPSVVAGYAWNVVIDAGKITDLLEGEVQERLALDPRLAPAPN